jgi:iron-sulfur cluster assembly protein
MITLTDSAANRVQEQLLHRGKGLGIRIGVRTSGCSGLSYILEFIDKIDSTLAIYESKGVHIYMDPRHSIYLQGTVMDWVSRGLNHEFEFRNPNSKNECGCGESFSI